MASRCRTEAASMWRNSVQAARPLVVRAAAARRGDGGGGASASAARRSKQGQLVRILLQQAQKEVLGGWLGDLLLPLVSDDPGVAAPLPPTQPAAALADEDSQFVEVDGVALHYKEAWPSSSSGSSGSASSSSGSASNNSSGGSSASGGGSNGSSSGGNGGLSAAAAAQQATILLVHGFNGSTFSYRSTMQPLADATGCRVVAFDRPPFGLAQRPLEWGKPGQRLQYNPYALDGSARLAIGLLDALGVGPVVAVGHSAGALVCMELAQRQPHRVAGLGFVAPALPTTPDNSFTRKANLGQQLRFLAVRGLLGDDTLGLRYVRRQILRRRDEVAAGNLGLGLEGEGQPGGVPQDIIDGYLKPLQAHDWDRGALLNFRAFSIPPAYDYAALGAPVLLVQGSNDGSLTQNARTLAELLQRRPAGHTRFVELEGVGHVPMDECPQQLNALLADFVRQAVLGQAAPAAR